MPHYTQSYPGIQVSRVCSWEALGGLGTLKGFKAKIYVDPDTPPRFNPALSVPYALRDKVEKELQRLQEEGYIRRKVS